MEAHADAGRGHSPAAGHHMAALAGRPEDNLCAAGGRRHGAPGQRRHLGSCSARLASWHQLGMLSTHSTHKLVSPLLNLWLLPTCVCLLPAGVCAPAGPHDGADLRRRRAGPPCGAAAARRTCIADHRRGGRGGWVGLGTTAMVYAAVHQA